jgi:hypothetical protein
VNITQQKISRICNSRTPAAREEPARQKNGGWKNVLFFTPFFRPPGRGAATFENKAN